jgi:PPK2 family polyphosphate:nucleotide phosphotransferase
MLDTSPYRVSPATRVDLSRHHPDARTGFDGGKMEGKTALRELKPRLADLQERLWAESQQSLLVVLQAIDTGGKDGTIRHVFTGVNPQGVHVRRFGVPSEWELAHDYLWRVHAHTPESGSITIFNRSHYEDVLVVRVKGLVPREVWSKRYHHIREFERTLSDEGTRIVKLFLHISKEEQRERLQARIDQHDKTWKFSKGDLAERARWDDHIAAFEDALSETSTDYAPWYVVPANRKWYRNLVVSTVLIETLEGMDPRVPEPEADLEGVVVK